MTDVLQNSMPLRPWIIVLGCCVLSLLSERTRRLGGFLFFCIIALYFIYNGMQHVMRSYAPPM